MGHKDWGGGGDMGREDRGQGDNVQEQAEALVWGQQSWKPALPYISETWLPSAARPGAHGAWAMLLGK